MAEEAKAVAIVPESVLKKRKRNEEWALAKTQAIVAQKKKSAENRKIIFKRAEQYAKEYKDQERELIRLKREAKLRISLSHCSSLAAEASNLESNDRRRRRVNVPAEASDLFSPPASFSLFWWARAGRWSIREEGEHAVVLGEWK